MPGVFDEGAISFFLIVAGVLTLLVGGIALALLRRALLRNMAASGAPRADDSTTADERMRRAAAVPLVLAIDRAIAGPGTGPEAPILRRMALAHVAAGLTFGLLAAILMLDPREGIPSALPLAVVAWPFVWPTVLVLWLLVGPDRRVQFLIFAGYLGGLAILCAIAWLRNTRGMPMPIGDFTLPGFLTPALIWVLYATPSLFLLLFLNGAIRTVGPLVLVFMFVLLLGSNLAISILALEPVMRAALTVALAVGLGGHSVFWGFAGLGALAAGWPAWRSATYLRDRYAAKKSSDLLLTVAAIWLLQALTLAFALFRDQGVIGAAAAVAAFLAWRLVLSAGLRPAVTAARARPPRRLLLLRVFGFGRRSRRLLDLLGRTLAADRQHRPHRGARPRRAHGRALDLHRVPARPSLATVHPDAGSIGGAARRDRPPARSRRALPHQPAVLRRADVEGGGHAADGGSVARGHGPARLQPTAPRLRVRAADAHGHGAARSPGFAVRQEHRHQGLDTLVNERWQELDAASPNLALRDATLRLLDTSGGDARTVRRLLAIADTPQSAPRSG